MPTDVGFWMLAIIVTAAVVAFAIWAGNNVVLKFKGFMFKTSDKTRNPVPTSDVKVAEDADVKGRVGRVIGKSIGEGESMAGKIEVAKGMKLDGSVDEIIGLKTEGTKHKTP